MQLDATIQIRGVNPYVPISRGQADRLKKGWRGPMPVLLRINGKPEVPWRINMMPKADGDFYLYLHGEVRNATQTRVGDRVRISLRFDAEYRGGPANPMPAWFRAPLGQNRVAKTAWDALPPSRRKEILRYFARLRSEEARRRNVEKAMFVLSGNSGRFMARQWENGR